MMKAMILFFGLVLGATPARAADAEKVRGTLVFDEGGTGRNSMAHWDEYGWNFEAIRWGRYYVEVSYFGLKQALGVQARLRSNGDDRAKGSLGPGGTEEEPETVRLEGTVYVPAHGEQEIVLFTPQDDPKYDLKIAGLKLVPAPEGEAVLPGDDGKVTLLAKDATTYSEKMRYEPKEEKNCLGFWVLPEDRAQWEFAVAATSEYEVSIFQGCGSDGGSKVAVEAGGKELSFIVEGTWGFQNWKDLRVGTLALEAGPNTLAIRPVEQVGKAVMDIQKIVLTPVK